MGVTTAVASLASAGFTAGGSILSGFGTSAGDKYQAELDDRNAEYGQLKAKQVSGQMTRNLSTTLGTIDAVRAAARTDPTSPTGAAVRDYTETVGTEQKDTTVDNILAQSQEDEANAAYLRSASTTALFSGFLGAGAAVGKGIASASGSLGGGGGGGVNPDSAQGQITYASSIFP